MCVVQKALRMKSTVVPPVPGTNFDEPYGTGRALAIISPLVKRRLPRVPRIVGPPSATRAVRGGSALVGPRRLFTLAPMLWSIETLVSCWTSNAWGSVSSGIPRVDVFAIE